MNFINITLVVFIMNNSVPTEIERARLEGNLGVYASKVGVNLTIKRKYIKDRTCIKRYPAWEQVNAYYYCVKARYAQQKKGQYNLFMREPFIIDGAEYGGGLGATCVKRKGGIGVAAYRSLQALASIMTAVHEFFHNLGAPHQEADPLEVMYPWYSSERINQYGPMSIGTGTQGAISQCQGVK